MTYISFVSSDTLELASKNPIGDLTISKFITYRYQASLLDDRDSREILRNLFV
jgi:hypothetical protein